MKEKIYTLLKFICFHSFFTFGLVMLIKAICRNTPINQHVSLGMINQILHCYVNIYFLILSIKWLIEYHTSPRDAFFPENKPIKFSLVLACFSATLLVLVICIVPFLSKVVGSNALKHFQNHSFELNSAIFKYTSLLEYASLFSIVFLAPVYEEILFRFFIYAWLKKQYNSVKRALLISSLLFGLAHVPGQIIDRASIGLIVLVFIAMFFLGTMICACYEKTGNIISAIILHILWNAFIGFGESLNSPYNDIFLILVFFCALVVLTIWFIIFLYKSAIGSIQVVCTDVRQETVLDTMTDVEREPIQDRETCKLDE